MTLHFQAIATQTSSDLAALLEANDLIVQRIMPLSDIDGPVSIHPGSPSELALCLDLSPDVRGRLGVTGDELLCVWLSRERQPSSFLIAIRRWLQAHDELSKSAVLIFAKDHRVEGICASAHIDPSAGYKTPHVVLTCDAVRVARSKSDEELKPLLQQAFREQAFSIDHFDTRGPVPYDLFGRTRICAQIESDIRRANEGIAILGIRRVGKTSILKRVVSQLANDPENPRLVSYYDAQTHSIESSARIVFEALYTALRQSAIDANCNVPAPSKRNSPQDKLRTLVEYLIREQSRFVVLAIDEIEWLVPNLEAQSDTQKGNDFISLFATLRSMKQTYGARLALIVCGINETFCEIPRINDKPNPNLDWYRPYYVTPLSHTDSTQMLREIALRMGINITEECLNKIWNSFGGHAYLARQFCSEALRTQLDRRSELNERDFERAYPTFMNRSGPIFSEILAQLAQFYPEEYETLRSIALHDQTHATTAPSLSSPAGIHLHNYGLVNREDSGIYQILMEAFREFVTVRTANAIRRERFRIIDSLGRGSAGTVYRAWDLESRTMCALKVYNAFIPQQVVHAEYEMLAKINSACIPKVIALSVFAERLAIAMELVEGRSLQTILQERVVIVGEDLVRLSSNLLQALETLHPKIGALDQTLSLQSTILANEPNATTGFLHRDLKPSNIIITNEATMDLKLVDLGLAASTQEARWSRVGTREYLPPDWGLVPWDTTFDLYAMARIFAQCVLGEMVGDNAVVSHLEALGIRDQESLEAAKHFFEHALAPHANKRYTSVKMLKQDWDFAIHAFV